MIQVNNKQKLINMHTWLVEHPDKNLTEYRKYLKENGNFPNATFTGMYACDEANRRYILHSTTLKKDDLCSYCPVKWSTSICLEDPEVEYLQYQMRFGTPDEQSLSARKLASYLIANWREEVTHDDTDNSL